jgi:hypothetical protein
MNAPQSEMTDETAVDAEPTSAPVPAPAEGDTEQASARPWRRAALAALATWVVSYVTYAIITVYSYRISMNPTPNLQNIFAAFKWNDVNFYTAITEYGYRSSPEAPAFYPMYPMVSWAVDQVLPGGALIACAVVAGICAYFCLLLLYRFVDLEFGTSTANRALLYFAAFPMAFYLYNGFNESMFVMFSIGALYAARRSHWWLAGTLAGLAGGTRLFGLLLAVPLAYEYLRQCGWNVRRIRWNVLSLGIVPLGLAAYSLYCKLEFDNWLAFVDAQAYWKRRYGWPGQSLFETLQMLYRDGWLGITFVPNEFYMITLFEAASLIFAIVLVILGFVGPWRLRRDQYFLLIASLVPIIAVSSTMVGEVKWLMSVPRFVLEWTAVFVVLARIGTNTFVDRLYLMLGFMLQAIMLATVALQAHWVA